VHVKVRAEEHDTMKAHPIKTQSKTQPFPAYLWRSVLSMMMAKDRMKGVSELVKGHEGLSRLSAT